MNIMQRAITHNIDLPKQYKIGLPWEPDSEINFHAYKLPLDMRTVKMGHIVSGYYIIVRAITGENGQPYPQIIGEPVTERYRIFQNAEIFSTVEQVLGEVFGEGGYVTCSILDQLAWYGGASIRQYIFTNSMHQIGKSRLYFRVIIKNGFDKSTSFVALAGAIDGFCTNGAIFGEFVQVRQRHVKALDMTGFSAWLKSAYEQFGKEITTVQQFQLHTITAQALPSVRRLLFNLAPDNKRFQENIGSELMKNIEYHGHNMWAVVSTATWWASTQEEGWAVPSSEASQLVAPARTLDRQQSVRRWIANHVKPYMAGEKK